MNQTNVRQRAFRALGDLCNGILSPDDEAWLADQLRENPGVCELYVDYLSMHACLIAESPVVGSPGAASGCDVADRAMPGPLFVAEDHLETGRRWEVSWATLAATIAAVAMCSSLLTYLLVSQSGSLLASGRTLHDGAPVARITGTQNCQWDDAMGEVGYGSVLVAGQTIRLRQGLVEITFEDGATVLLESPATVEFKGAHEVQVREGRLAAVVPPESNSFHVQTETLDLENSGTEFGLLARDTGTSELHVFNGRVRASVLNPAGGPRKQFEVKATEAVMASPLSASVVEFPANESYFVRSMAPPAGPHDGLLAYEGFLYPPGPLAEQNGGFGWAGPWFDVEVDEQAGPDSNCVGTGSLAIQGFVPRGNRATITAQYNRIRRALATSVGGVFDVAGLVENQNGVRLIGRDGNTVYLSFLQRVTATDDGFYGLELHRGDGNPNRVLCIGNGADDTGYGATSAYNVYGVKNFPALGEENTTVNFYVVKITFGGDNRDVVEVYRNPASLSDEQACHVDAVLRGNFAFDRISLANFDGSKTHEIDELRVGVHFLAVTGRWGGERGRLLRSINQYSAVKKPGAATARTSWGLSVTRETFLLATDQFWANAVFLRQ